MTDQREVRMLRWAQENGRALNLLIQANYADIERRMLVAAGAGEDPYVAGAAVAFGIAPETVTTEQRTFAKQLAYGVFYNVRCGEPGSPNALIRLRDEVATITGRKPSAPELQNVSPRRK